MPYFECFGTNRFCNRTGIAAVVAAVLLLCSPFMLSADSQDCSHEGNTPSRCQTQGTNSAARHPASQSEGEPDEKSSQGSCIVDLKPGDERLFEQSASTAGKLHRWLDLQAASIATLYLFVKNGRGVITANQQQYQVAVRGRFKFDAKGQFSINTGLYTGANFIAGSNNTGLGLAGAQSNLYLKHLYLSARREDRDYTGASSGNGRAAADMRPSAKLAGYWAGCQTRECAPRKALPCEFVVSDLFSRSSKLWHGSERALTERKRVTANGADSALNSLDFVIR